MTALRNRRIMTMRYSFLSSWHGGIIRDSTTLRIQEQAGVRPKKASRCCKSAARSSCTKSTQSKMVRNGWQRNTELN